MIRKMEKIVKDKIEYIYILRKILNNIIAISSQPSHSKIDYTFVQLYIPEKDKYAK